uniref:Uncharacterized protein n=1 Tax=Peronospora matthiolae TaxID=2874970 RepID=A0AAV1UQB4_9STRA
MVCDAVGVMFPLWVQLVLSMYRHSLTSSLTRERDAVSKALDNLSRVGTPFRDGELGQVHLLVPCRDPKQLVETAGSHRYDLFIGALRASDFLSLRLPSISLGYSNGSQSLEIDSSRPSLPAKDVRTTSGCLHVVAVFAALSTADRMGARLATTRGLHQANRVARSLPLGTHRPVVHPQSTWTGANNQTDNRHAGLDIHHLTTEKSASKLPLPLIVDQPLE